MTHLKEPELEVFFIARCSTLLMRLAHASPHTENSSYILLFYRVIINQNPYIPNLAFAIIVIMTGSRAMAARLLGKTQLERKMVQNQSGEIYKAHLDNKCIHLQKGASVQVQGG